MEPLNFNNNTPNTSNNTSKWIISLMASLLLMTSVQFANAHGTVIAPPSRVWNCYQENPENPISAACIAAVVSHGSQPLYDWSEINQGMAFGQHTDLVPDGNLASGGRPDKYGGMDQVRSDWVATSVAAGPFTVTWTNSAPHATSYYQVYITNADWTPDQPLTWSSLTLLVETAPSPAESMVDIPVTLPSRTGKHVIYSVWQRSDSPEAFYSTSDVDFGEVLPIELISFRADIVDNNIKLAWATASETNNAYFEVEHSIDGTNFRAIESIAANGSTQETQQYHFIDKNPANGANYYRLRQVDMNGEYEYSPVEAVHLKSAIAINMHPTMATDLLYITLDETRTTDLEFQVFNAIGQYIQSLNIAADKTILEYPIADLVNGIYFIRFDLDGVIVTKQFVKL